MRSTSSLRTGSVFSSLLVLSGTVLEVAAQTTLTPASELPGKWVYQGCWTDVGRTINAAAYDDGKGMTGETCVAYCSASGWQYAGTEYSQECYCGNTLAATSKPAQEADCNTSCSGNSTQACGGGGRLSLYHSTESVGPQPNPGVNNFTYLGCYSEGANGRALTTPITSIPSSNMTVAACTAACTANKFILAGVEYSGECYCGNTIANGGAPATDGCNMMCNGNRSEFCGGGGRLNVYNFQNKYSPTPSPATADTATGTPGSSAVTATDPVSKNQATQPTPTGPSQPPTVSNYSFYGCRTEANGARALSDKTTATDTMTLEVCQTFCAGFSFFGVEYGRECYCGNSFAAGSVAAPTADCGFTCPGDASQFCGAGNRLSVYAKNGTAIPSSAATGTSSGTVSASATSPVAAAPTAIPSGWSAQGCYIDGANGRILPYQAQDNQQLTLASCASLCAGQGYTVSGTEYAVQCFCGNALVNGGKKVNDTDCTTPCSGNKNEICGASGRMSIVSLGPPQVLLPPTPQTGGLNGSWAYQGCYQDNVNQQRTFYWQNFLPKVMTPALCLSRCASFGYAAAGLEYGEECYCGDPTNIVTVGAAKVDESECNIVCAGNVSAICGGGSRLSTYFWTGARPLYSWDFRTGAAAGAYDFLIGGVTIPLMVSESVTGKVNFLSKWGTGPANETGAYELDLSLLGNSSQAWRPLHVKTDIFCAAGLTLPDKGGRHLTIGGWSGDSTEGVRLYWPDGSPGVRGTRDWQENVHELSLQVGRWYPSAMQMANGSIMVIGGEVGSNAAAVPSIEVLPATGQAPLYMDWLARTDPNNLYPFCAVLPGGGIFVAYYNEARILDEVTFTTKRVLPNAPGAVNDATAGRTYPLEGTAVLLPQRAPYTDPLGVLICGGSTIGVANALDNCVSITPEVPNANWTLERMPSRRVMPCMAPLPDGTYLIVNGAQHGVAGFGLANTPNLNALLYNPSKAVGSRISVLANTTVARLYHSEAVTLLDGRVLIAGSDPEDGVNPQEYRVETFSPPYLLSGRIRPTFTLANRDWAYGESVTFTVGARSRYTGAFSVSMLGAVSSTHGNSMGARTLFPALLCTDTTCTVTAPPNAHVAPPGWYQFFVLDGGMPAVGVYVRLGKDPGQLGNWPASSDFTVPGL